MDSETLIDLENSLQTATNALRHAWKLMKHNGMETAAKELADTVLDVEAATEEVAAHRLATKV